MNFNEVEEKMKERIDFLVESFAEVRAGRANPAILNKVMVEYYGTMTPINQVAGISVPDARLIVVQPWDASVLKAVEKAIIDANIGIYPQNDGKCIRLSFPELTQERRKEIIKDVKEMAEQSKVSVRNIRRDAMDELKKEEKNKEISEDELKRGEENVQKLTDKYIKMIDEKFAAKEREIATV